ncbi:hypothetical protein BGZ91_002285 [Linnemannia elongata]|nr:hypothetical protein BGZ91_002285 [Linnemannia elongata]
MKEHEASSLAFEYPPPDSYFLKQRHADTLDGSDTEADADSDTVYKELSLLAKFEAPVNEAEVPTVQSSLRTQSLDHPLSPSPTHILRDSAGGRVSVLSTSTALEATETDQSNSGTTGGSRGSVDLSAAQGDKPTNSRNNSATFSSRGKPFQATISTNTGGSSLPRNIEATDSIQQHAIPQVNEDVVAAGNGDYRIIDDFCPPSADGGPMAPPGSHRDGPTDDPPAPFESRTTQHYINTSTSNYPPSHRQ